jgi:nucleoside-diphosphate-sugar epimerase
MSLPTQPRPAESRHAKAVLVTGGTGFLGGWLVRRLLAGGYAVRVLVRREAQAREQSQLGADPVVGDVTDRAALEAALEGVTAVYHLAGKLLEPGEPAEEYQRTHVQGTELLLECCRRMSTLPRFVHCSTTGVLGSTGREPASEEAPLRPTNVYEATKAEAELAVTAAIKDGLPASIVRPGLVYGPGDWHLVKFYSAVLGHRFRPIGRHDVWLHPVYIDDMTDAFLLCGTDERAVGECFHIAGPEVVSLAQLASTIARAGGTTLPRGRIPFPLATAAATAFDLLPDHLRRRAPLTRSRLDFLTHSRVYDVSKAREVLGFSAPTDLETGVRRTMCWYLDSVPRSPVAESRLAAVGD